MKTLKELLFERHRDAEPALELDRQEFLARFRAAQSPMRQERRGLGRLWHEYLFPLRWHLTGLSAVWLAVLLLHFDTSAAPAARIAKASSPDPRQVLAALREKRQELLDLTAPPAARLSLPPRRSEAAPVRSAGFQTCCIADFQVGWRLPRHAGLEACDAASLETCATANMHLTTAIG